MLFAGVMKTTIVTGLLGSGKTTFIKNSLQVLKQKTVVLVNDFGAAGIDGEIFSAGGIEAVELPSGCICCTLKPDLITTIQKIIREFAPGHLVIEPSGIASPSVLLEALGSAGITSFTVVGIVDVTEFIELYQSGMYGSFFEDQIRFSDVILVNKTDLVDEPKITETMNRIEAINPWSILFRTVRARLLPPLIDSITAARERPPFWSTPLEKKTAHAHFDFQTLSFNLRKEVGLAAFSSVFSDLAAGRYGKVARAKALLRTEKGPYRFDGVFGKVDSVQFERNIEEGKVVVIGEGLDQQAIEERLSGMA